MANKLKLSKKHGGCALPVADICRLRHKFGMPKAHVTELIDRAVKSIVSEMPILESDLEYEKAYIAEQSIKQGRR